MFQNISFTFLCALAFISWSLLCYLDAIDEHKIENDYKVELYTEGPSLEAPKHCLIKTVETSWLNRLFDLAVAYSLILLVTIAISKSLQWLELQATACIQDTIGMENIQMFPSIEFLDDGGTTEPEVTEPVKIVQRDADYPLQEKWQGSENWNLEKKWARGDDLPTEGTWAPSDIWVPQSMPEDLKHSLEANRNMNQQRAEAEPLVETWPNWESVKPERRVSEPELLPQYHRENIELKEQLNDLQERCRDLLQELRAVNSLTKTSCIELRPNPSESSFGSSDDSSGVILWKQPAVTSSSGLSVASTADSASHNVYVTHSHYHINFSGPVQLTKQDINVDLSGSKKLRRRSEFLQVWGTFIKGPQEHPMLTGINNILM